MLASTRAGYGRAHKFARRGAFYGWMRDVTRAPLRAFAPLLRRRVPKPRLTARQRRRVVALLKPEAQRVRELTGVPIGHWRV